MNDVYFACRTCKTYQDAGYRWCYWTLEEPGIVKQGSLVDVRAIMSASEYWQGAEQESYLGRLLPEVEAFLERHRTHDLIYDDHNFQFDGTREVILNSEPWDVSFLDWLNEGEDAAEEVQPRYFIERLGYTDWEQVRLYMARLKRKPWWWKFPEVREEAKNIFLSLTAS